MIFYIFQGYRLDFCKLHHYISLMEIVTIKHRSTGCLTDHFIFKDRKEFEQYFLKNHQVVPKLVENWQDCIKGDWVLADDGGVCQILYNKDNLPHATDFASKSPVAKGYCRTAVGSFTKSKDCFLDTDLDLHKGVSRYRFFYKNKITGNVRIPRNDNYRGNREEIIGARKNMTYNELKFWVLVLSRLDPVEAYMKIWKNKNPRASKKYAFLLLSQERFKNKMSDEIKQAAEELKIDHKFILKNFKTMMEESKDEDFKFKVNSELGDIIGTRKTTAPNRLAAGIMMGQLGSGALDEADYETSAVEVKDDNAVEVKDDNGEHKSP